MLLLPELPKARLCVNKDIWESVKCAQGRFNNMCVLIKLYISHVVLDGHDPALKAIFGVCV